MQSPHTIQVEREVPPRTSDAPIIRGYLLRHPFIHFAVTFCYWLTGVSLLHFIDAHWLRLLQPQPDSYRLFFAFGMAVIFFAEARRRMRRSAARSDADSALTI
jgi:hypothetical protein